MRHQNVHPRHCLVEPCQGPIEAQRSPCLDACWAVDLASVSISYLIVMIVLCYSGLQCNLGDVQACLEDDALSRGCSRGCQGSVPLICSRADQLTGPPFLPLTVSANSFHLLWGQTIRRNNFLIGRKKLLASCEIDQRNLVVCACRQRPLPLVDALSSFLFPPSHNPTTFRNGKEKKGKPRG